MMQSLTDIASLVDEAYDSVECVGRCPGGHGSDRVAYQIGHGCADGFLCAVHFDTALAVRRRTQQSLDDYEAVTCARCHCEFSAVDEFIKLYSL